MDPKKKEAFENIKFYKFYPVKTPETPDVDSVKVWSGVVFTSQNIWTSFEPDLTLYLLFSAVKVHQ